MTLVVGYQREGYAVVSTDLFSRRISSQLVRLKGVSESIRLGNHKVLFNEKFKKSKAGTHWIALSGHYESSVGKAVYRTPWNKIIEQGVELFKPLETQSEISLLFHRPGENLHFCSSNDPANYKLQTLPPLEIISFGQPEWHQSLAREIHNWSKSPEEVARLVHEVVRSIVNKNAQLDINNPHFLKGTTTYLVNHTVRIIAHN